ncbi:MAG: efflux transporter outer membrane subunit [Planctomycetota bacterium]
MDPTPKMKPGRRGRALALAAVLAFAISCRTADREPEPPVELPEAFSDTGGATLDSRWWTEFDDPTLDALVEQALTGNFNLLVAWDRLAESQAIARKAGAALTPDLDATAGAGAAATRSLVDTPAGEEVVRDKNANYSLGLVASWEVDVWGRVRAGRDAAAYDAVAAAEDVQATALILSAEIASTWYQLVEQTGRVRILTGQIETNERVLEFLEARFTRGRTGAVDVIQQRQLTESRRGDLTEAKAAMATTRLRLATLLGLPPGKELPEAPEDLVELPPLPETGFPADLVRRRPDVRSAMNGVLAADRRVAAAVADRFPRLTLSASADTSADNVSDLFENWIASIAAGLVAPIIDGGRRSAEVERTEAKARAAVHRYGQAVLEALQEVEAALVAERKQRDLIASLTVQLELARQSMDQLRQNYTNGAVDYLRVLAALESVQRLERTLLFQNRELITARIELNRALAGGFPLERPEGAAGSDEGVQP